MIAPKSMLALLTVATLALFLTGADQKASTENGQEVILHDDGTWTYVVKSTAAKIAGGAALYTKDPNAVLQYKGKRGNFGLYLSSGEWTQVPKSSNPSAEAQFEFKDGDVWAVIISERLTMPLDTLKEAALAYWREADADARIIKEERRRVNGKEVLCLIANVKPRGIPLTFYGYYYSGKQGAVQVVTWTGQNLFDEVKPEMGKFLNGFVVFDK
jgi:hypothetical protein